MKTILQFLFGCKHPFDALRVEKEHTETDNPKYPMDYTDVCYHLHCQKCGKNLPLKHAKIKGSIKEFFARG